MKWLGQYIQSFVARFRSDVYLESISSGTIVSGGNLGLDSNNKVVKATVSGGSGISFDGSTANGVLTYKDADEATVEQYLTFANTSNISRLQLLSDQDTNDSFTIATTTHGATTLTAVDDDVSNSRASFDVVADGYIELASAGNITLDASGDIVLEAGGDDLTLDADTFTFTSATSQKPNIFIEDTSNDADGSRFIFNKNRGAAGVDADLITAIQFKSYNNAGTPEHINYAQILPKIHSNVDGVESGQLIFQVQAHGGGNENGLVLTGGSQDDEVDVTVGLGTSSVTTIAGTLTMGSTATIDNSGAWVGGVIPSAKLDEDTAHLDVAQTFGAAKTFGTTTKLQFRDANAYINSPDANDLEIAATDITLDAAGQINLDAGAAGLINLQEAGTTIANFSAHHSATYLTMYENEGASDVDYFEISVAAAGATTIKTTDAAAAGANLAFEIDGKFSVSSTGIDIDQDGVITNSVWNGTKVTDIYTNSSGRRFGNTIKILPNDFIANDEGSIGVAFDDDANTGMVLEDTASEMWAFVTIPEGMKATDVNIYSNNSSRSFYVYEMDIDANGLGSSLGNNTLNSAVTGLSVSATSTNFLAIKLDLSATNQRIRGGLVTIAPQ